jgi:pyridoxal phosphate enzyme (YggS family)
MTDKTDQSDIAANLAAVQARIVAAARDAGRDPKTVTLIAVSKGHGVGAITAALEAGQRVFGENRVQEAAAKWPDLRQRYPDIELHLIGPLQTNKIPDALGLFDVIETLDRPRLVSRLAAQGTARHPLYYVQVNTGEEPQKAGVIPAEADAFITACREDHRITPAGLMCIPPQGEEPSPHFALLAKIAARHGLAHLSMGMSADFETAIAFGATHVRVGTAIFGTR